jgi:hypothetical protein
MPSYSTGKEKKENFEIRMLRQHRSGQIALFQKPRWDFGAPDCQRFVSRWTIPDRCLVIDQIAIGIMLNHISSRIPPVVKDLRSEDVPAHTPDRLILLVGKPLVSKLLSVKVMNLERAMMDMRSRIGADEEAVVVYIIAATINMSEKRDVLLLAILIDIEEVTRNYVKVCGVERDQFVKLLRTESKMPELRLAVSLTYFMMASLGVRTLCTAAGPGWKRRNLRMRGFSSS